MDLILTKQFNGRFFRQSEQKILIRRRFYLEISSGLVKLVFRLRTSLKILYMTLSQEQDF